MPSSYLFLLIIQFNVMDRAEIFRSVLSPDGLIFRPHLAGAVGDVGAGDVEGKNPY